MTSSLVGSEMCIRDRAGTNTYLLKVSGHILPDYGHGSLHPGLPLELQLLFVISIDNLDRPIPATLRSANAKGKILSDWTCRA
eukprot:4315705-Prorocentrum_lima.AAC.1